MMYAIGEGRRRYQRCRRNCWHNADRIYAMVDAGKEVSFEDRAAGRRTQVRAVARAVSAVDEIFARCGGNGTRMDKPLQRYWRDVHVGQAHAIHVPGTVYHASALSCSAWTRKGRTGDDLRGSDDRSEKALAM